MRRFGFRIIALTLGAFFLTPTSQVYAQFPVTDMNSIVQAVEANVNYLEQAVQVQAAAFSSEGIGAAIGKATSSFSEFTGQLQEQKAKLEAKKAKYEQRKAKLEKRKAQLEAAKKKVEEAKAKAKSYKNQYDSYKNTVNNAVNTVKSAGDVIDAVKSGDWEKAANLAEQTYDSAKTSAQDIKNQAGTIGDTVKSLSSDIQSTGADFKQEMKDIAQEADENIEKAEQNYQNAKAAQKEAKQAYKEAKQEHKEAQKAAKEEKKIIEKGKDANQAAHDLINQVESGNYTLTKEQQQSYDQLKSLTQTQDKLLNEYDAQNQQIQTLKKEAEQQYQEDKQQLKTDYKNDKKQIKQEIKSFRKRPSAALAPLPSASHAVYVSTETMAFGQTSVYTGTTETNIFIFPDALASFCEINAEDVKEEGVMTSCLNKLLELKNSKDMALKQEAVDVCRLAYQQFVVAGIEEAVIAKQNLYNFEKDTLPSLMEKSQSANDERLLFGSLSAIDTENVNLLHTTATNYTTQSMLAAFKDFCDLEVQQESDIDN